VAVAEGVIVFDGVSDGVRELVSVNVGDRVNVTVGVSVEAGVKDEVGFAASV